jgi:putative hydrolase of the HAD superfamily
MKSRSHIFFDLDHTLWDFERNAHETISELLVEFSPLIGADLDNHQFFAGYSRINRALWDAFERGEIPMTDLRQGRWEQAFQRMEVDPGPWLGDFALEYQDRCPGKPHLMAGSLELLQALRADYRLGIISNGVIANQTRKLRSAGIEDYFEDLVTLDLAGHAKPDPRIFQFALARAGVDAHDAMHIGDSYPGDVLGAHQAGLSVIFFNPDGDANPEGFPEVPHMAALLDMIPKAWR